MNTPRGMKGVFQIPVIAVLLIAAIALIFLRPAAFVQSSPGYSNPLDTSFTVQCEKTGDAELAIINFPEGLTPANVQLNRDNSYVDISEPGKTTRFPGSRLKTQVLENELRVFFDAPIPQSTASCGMNFHLEFIEPGTTTTTVYVGEPTTTTIKIVTVGGSSPAPVVTTTTLEKVTEEDFLGKFFRSLNEGLEKLVDGVIKSFNELLSRG